MTKEEFGRRVAGMMGTLYRVCYAQFCRQCDREDAVQEALRRAWEKRDTLRYGADGGIAGRSRAAGGGRRAA